MDCRIHQLIAGARLQEDIRAAAAAREAKAARDCLPRRGWFRNAPTVAARRRFARRPQTSTTADR